MGHPALVQAFRLDGVITLVDAVHGDATLDNHIEAVKQVAVADRIVISKADLVSAPEKLEALRGRLRQINPSALLVDAASMQGGHAALFECGLYDPASKTADVRRWLGEAADDGHHHDHHHADHGHGDEHHHHHNSRIRTFTLVHDRPIPFSAIETFLDLLRSTHGDRLLRMKGVIELQEDPAHPLVVHGVQTLLHPPVRLPAWPDATRGTRLVLITLDMPEDYVRRLFAGITGTPAVDTPDRAALEANPLAIPGMR